MCCHLQVACETDVFTAVCMWVAACPCERRPQLADLVRSCVRCGAMELRELEALDQHPQVCVEKREALTYVEMGTCACRTQGRGTRRWGQGRGGACVMVGAHVGAEGQRGGRAIGTWWALLAF